MTKLSNSVLVGVTIPNQQYIRGVFRTKFPFFSLVCISKSFSDRVSIATVYRYEPAAFSLLPVSIVISIF